MGEKNTTPMPVKRLTRWIRSRSVREQLAMGTITAIIVMVMLRVWFNDHTFFYGGTQVAHGTGLLILIYKLTITKTCSGLSLKTQELTAIFIILRMMVSYGFLRDMHVVLDSVTLGATLFVIYMMRFKLKNTYTKDHDNLPLYYVLVPCAILSIVGHPGYQAGVFNGFFFMYYITIEAVAVLPQLRLIQNAKLVEPFTAHYVFALGIARFLACSNWINMLIDSGGSLLTQIGQGHLYIVVALLAEIVQTFILSDFCYYYVKRYTSSLLLRMKYAKSKQGNL